MPQHDENHVKLCGGVLVWDGITRPETQSEGKNAGKLKWSLKALFPPTCQDLPLFDALANKVLAESEFNGVLPQGGRMPINVVGPTEFNGMFPGWLVISFKTTLRAPDVYDDNGQLLDPMRYGPLIFTGQSVDVLAHCYAYNQKSKGVAGGLDGFSINLAANAPRLDLGGGGPDTAAAFGGQAQGQAPNQGGQAQYGQPQGQAPNQGGQAQYGQPQGQAPNQGGQAGYQPQGQAQGQQPAPQGQYQAQGQVQPVYQPVQQPAQNGQPQGQQPHQATNFMPNQ